MIALYILLGFLLLLFLITLLSVHVYFDFVDEPVLSVRVLFVRIPILPAKEKKQKPEKKKKQKKKKKPEPKKEEKKEEKPKKEKKSLITKLREKKGLTGILSLLTELSKLAGTTLKNLFSHIVIHKFDFGIMLSGEDASSVAVNYGRLCSVVYPAVNIITAATKCKDYNVTLEPVFDPDRKTEIYVSVHAHLRIVFAVWEALKAGVKLLIIRIKL